MPLLATLNLIVGTNGSRLVVRVEQTGKHRHQETKWFPFFFFLGLLLKAEV